MKTKLVILGILASFMISLGAFSQDAVMDSKSASKEVRKLIRKELKYPDFARENELKCCAAVEIKILKDGSLDVLCLNCPTRELKEYVEKNIEQLRSKKLLKYAGQTVKIKINFEFMQN